MIELKTLADIEEPRHDAQQSSSSATMERSLDSATSGTGNKNDQPKLRNPRLSSRRHLSKSEPAGQDGTIDSEDQFTDCSGESQTLLGSSLTVSGDHNTESENNLTDNNSAPEPTSIRS